MNHVTIEKGAYILESGTPTESDLGLIHTLSRGKLSAEELYTFSVCLCDNEVDRDGERFTNDTLEGLAPLFVGKSGIFDHQWSAQNQTARIYRTELVKEAYIAPLSQAPYWYLKGYAYMLRCEKNKDLIAEIEGGIKKEVSVGCSVERGVCSVCGELYQDCIHEKGQTYGNQGCYVELVGATDAYEWSFVAVPAQRKAGVMKSVDKITQTKSAPVGSQSLLEYEAMLGRKYLKDLRGEVARLGKLVTPEVEGSAIDRMTQLLGEEELSAMKKGYETKLEHQFLGGTQLYYPTDPCQSGDRDGAFLI